MVVEITDGPPLPGKKTQKVKEELYSTPRIKTVALRLMLNILMGLLSQATAIHEIFCHDFETVVDFQLNGNVKTS